MDRLDLLASLAKSSEVLLDVGCDHGYAIANALRYYDVKKAIASELTKVQLDNARRTIFSYNLEDRVKFIVSSGFQNINDEFDTVIIAGMGGHLISNILLEGEAKLHNAKLILQPNKDASLVRETLVKLNYEIIDEYSIIDKNKYYEIIEAKKGIKEYTPYELKYGPILVKKKNEAFITHYKGILKLLETVISSLNNKNEALLKQEEIKEIKTVLGE